MNNFITDTDANTADTELIAEALQGNRPALDTLVRRHQLFIYNVALKMALDPDDAEDITQDVLVKVITNLSSFKAIRSTVN